MNFSQIKAEAARVAREAGVESTIPTPLETIAYYLGFNSLGFRGSSDIAGAIDHGKRQIFINSDDPPTRQRFTLAHEIGHAVLHSGDSVIDYRKNFEGPAEAKEREANYFAASLLMPEDLFRNAWFSRNGNVDRVAALFGVSSLAASYRAKSLGIG